MLRRPRSCCGDAMIYSVSVGGVTLFAAQVTGSKNFNICPVVLDNAHMLQRDFLCMPIVPEKSMFRGVDTLACNLAIRTVLYSVSPFPVDPLVPTDCRARDGRSVKLSLSPKLRDLPSRWCSLNRRVAFVPPVVSQCTAHRIYPDIVAVSRHECVL